MSAPVERAANGRAPRRAHRDADHETIGRLAQRRAGDALVGACRSAPARASNAQPVISPTAPASRSASASARVMMPSCTSGAILADRADADEADVGALDEVENGCAPRRRLVRSSRSSTERAMTGSGIG